MATRQALAEAAIRLFVEHGYDETTVEDIAAAAGVSPRTFFLHFPSKAAATFPDHEEHVVGFRAALAAQPPDREPLQHLRSVLLQGIRDQTASPMRKERYRLLERIPALADEDARTDRDYEQAIVEHLAAVWGTSTEARLRCEATAGVTMALVRAVLVAWGRDDVDAVAAMELVLSRTFGSPFETSLQGLQPAAVDGTDGRSSPHSPQARPVQLR
jgi:AcrR family transcriptional regulator